MKGIGLEGKIVSQFHTSGSLVFYKLLERDKKFQRTSGFLFY